MDVLKATPDQKKSLDGIYKEGAALQFVQDSAGNWIVNTRVLTDPNFEDIWDELSKLEVIEFIE